MREFTYQIQYVKGKYNFVTVNLSRPVLITYQIPETTLLGKTKEEMRALQVAKAKWGEIIEYLEGGQIPKRTYPRSTLHQFALWDGVLYYCVTKSDGSVHYCLIVPSDLKALSLELAHSQVGHLGQKKTLAKAEETFYWSNLKSDVCKFVQECLTCQQFKGAPGLQQQWQELPSV